MIATINGTLVETTPLQAIIEVHGMGYAVHVPVTTTEKLPAVGQAVTLYTLPVYREDEHTLYGFHSREERECFRLLIQKVSGIGPRIALSLLSKMSAATLKSAIANADTTLLAKCPGIGKKTAERLVVELRDTLVSATLSSLSKQPLLSSGGTPLSTEPTTVKDAVQALVILGYKLADADKAVRHALSDLGLQTTTEALIRKALG